MPDDACKSLARCASLSSVRRLLWNFGLRLYCVQVKDPPLLGPVMEAGGLKLRRL